MSKLCPDCGNGCPLVHFIGEELPRVLCERAHAKWLADAEARRARAAAVSLVSVMDELQALRRAAVSVEQLVRRWEAEGFPPSRGGVD